MSILPYILIFCLLNSIYANDLEDDNDSEDYNIFICLTNISDDTPIIDYFSKETIICILNMTQYNPNDTYNFLKIAKILIPDSSFDQIEIYFNERNLTYLYDVIIDIVKNESNTFIDDLFKIINNPESSKFLNYCINIIQDPRDTDDVLSNLQNIFDLPGVKELCLYIYSKIRDNLVDLIETIVSGSRFDDLFHLIKKYIDDYKDPIFNFLYELMRNLGKRKGIVASIRDYILYNNENPKLLNDTFALITNKTIVDTLFNITIFDSQEKSVKITKEIVSNIDLMEFLFAFFHNQTFVNDLSDIIMNLDDKVFLENHLGKFVDVILGDKHQNLDFLIKSVITILRNLINQNDFIKFMGTDLSNALRKYIFDKDNLVFNENQNCAELFNYTYFEKSSEDFRYYYFKKITIETTKNKNDILTYENCLNDKHPSSESEKYNIKPIFLVGIINDDYNQKKLKDSIYLEKYSYIIGLCVPYGIDEKTGVEMCSKKDYSTIIKDFTQISSNINNSNIDSFYLDKEGIQITDKDRLYFFFSVLVIIFPLIIKLFLFIANIIIEKKYSKGIIVNKLSTDKDKIINDTKKEDKMIEARNPSLLLIYPRWFIFLSEYFDIVNNIAELFNFTSTQTFYNNLNGITYIKGILGIAILFNIFGLTFFILSNLPHKILASQQFYDTVTSPFYFILFIGLRYAPRIIFSCSGYSLIYKFLFYIEEDSSFYFIKFLLYHSYKYVLLFFVSLYMRFGLYYIDIIFRTKKSMIFELFKHSLEKNDRNYFLNLFTLLFYNVSEFENNESVIQYLYLPLNEVFLFIFGVSLISLGYKFKLRTDLIIIVLIIILYLSKIILFFPQMYNKQIYSTLYFYLFGYGSIMLNPIFNLPSFLIGMYFGLINFTIQRGLNDDNAEATYTKVELLGPKRDTLKLNTTMRHFDNEVLKRKATFEVNAISPLNQSHIFFNQNQSYFVEQVNNQANYDDFNIKQKNVDIIKEMPFLKSAIHFSNFYRRNHQKTYFKVILAIFIILLIFFISIRYLYIYLYIGRYLGKEGVSEVDTLSFDKVIPNLFLNLIYMLDIEIFVFIIHWIGFFIYFKGSQLNDFFDSIYWSFFIKSYFSYSLVSSLIIVYIFYQSETVITMTIYNTILYSSLSIVFVFLAVIVFYGFYEYPLKKIFKTVKIKNSLINIENEDLDEYDYNDDDKNDFD